MSRDGIPAEKLHTAHDRLFRRVLSDPTHARGVLQRILPARLVAGLDWSTLSLIPGSYIDEELREARSDLLFVVNRKAEAHPALLYLLFEHQRAQHPRMPLRMLDYGTRALTDFAARRGQKRQPLPRLIPVVLHQGPGPWTAARRLSDLHGLPGASDPVWVDIEIIVHELGEEHLELLRTAQQMTALARATLLLMKLVAEHRSLRNHLALVARVLDEVRTLHGGSAVTPLFVYLASTRGTREEIDAIMQSLTQQTQSTVLTVYEQILAEGEARGFARGEARGFTRGEARGFARGEATLLLKQLRVRFGTLPATLVRRVETAEVSDLECWAERLLDATTLGEVFEG